MNVEQTQCGDVHRSHRNPFADPPPAEQLILEERFPDCFNRENPRPLKLGIHRDLLLAEGVAGLFNLTAIRRALGRYCARPRYRKSLKEGATRVDLGGRSAGVVTTGDAAGSDRFNRRGGPRGGPRPPRGRALSRPERAEGIPVYRHTVPHEENPC